jgi:DNA polymerase (family 10)
VPGRYDGVMMSRNAEIAAQFDEIADRLLLLGEGWFKVRAYRRAAEVIRTASEDVATLAAEGRLKTLPGVGDAIAKKISDYLATGHIPLLDRLRAQTSDDELALLRAGLAPAQVREVREKVGVTAPEALRAVLAQGKAALSEKTLAALRQALASNVGDGTPPV